MDESRFLQGFNEELEKIALTLADPGTVLQRVGSGLGRTATGAGIGALGGGVGGALLGGGIGYLSGDTPEERRHRALAGAVGGGALGGLAGGVGGGAIGWGTGVAKGGIPRAVEGLSETGQGIAQLPGKAGQTWMRGARMMAGPSTVPVQLNYT